MPAKALSICHWKCHTEAPDEMTEVPGSISALVPIVVLLKPIHTYLSTNWANDLVWIGPKTNFLVPEQIGGWIEI